MTTKQTSTLKQATASPGGQAKAEVQAFLDRLSRALTGGDGAAAATRAEIVELDWLTHRIAIVQVRWPQLNARGKEVGEETSTYTLRRDESGGLRLQVAIMHGASTEPEAA
jgi:hypothetical protein